MNQSYVLYKKNPNKRAHDLNKEIKKGFFSISSYFNFSTFFNDSVLFFMPEEETAKQKTKIKW